MHAAKDKLTAREEQVLALLAEGKTAAQISSILVVSVPTVRFHIKNIRRKLGFTGLGWAAMAGLPRLHHHPGPNPQNLPI